MPSTTPPRGRGRGPWHRPDRTPSPLPPIGIGEHFLATADAGPGQVALRSPAGAWTFDRLATDALSVAAALSASAGPVPQVDPAPIGVLATHDGPLVVAVMGIVVSGHIVVVLDPAAPRAEQAHVVSESGLAVVVHDAEHADAARDLVGAAGSLVALDQVEPAPFSAPGRQPSDPLMLAFTSGTSGTSKAGTITHGVLANLVRGATEALGITADDRMPMLFPTSLAVAAYPMFLPLLNGGTLCTLDVRSVGLAPLADFLADERITLAYMAPTVVRFLTDALAGRSFPDLRMIALGGELVDAEVVRLTADIFGPRHIANGFGTTETGVITLYVLDPDEEVDGPVPAGHPVPDVEVLVLDDHGSVLPTGEAGEVAVASPHLFAGYWGHPELSAQVLGPDPQGRDGWGLYRTGDLGRLDGDGALTVLGRTDTKVKVRGRFVVLGDVEADLHGLDEVADAVVVPVAGATGTELGAVVAPAAGTTVDPQVLRARLLEGNEGYRVPGRWRIVDALPQLPNGKLDRRAAAALVETSDDVTQPAPTASVEPEAATVRALREIWELLLPVGVVGLDDDFTALGGHSLLAAQMLIMVEQRLDVIVPMGELVAARTLRQLAAVVDRIAVDGAPTTAACVQRGAPGQPPLWFVHDLQGSAYRVRHLAEELGPDQPVWSFESPLLRGVANPYRSLDTFAAGYVRDLLRVQPEGPYWLGGYSFGGVCAYEMARQLTRDGHEVAFVGVVDVGPGYRGPGWGNDRSPLRPWFGIAPPPPEGSGLADTVAHYRAMVQRSPKGAVRHLMVRSGASRLVDPLRFRADIRRQGQVRPEWRLWYAWEEHWALASRHWKRTNPYAGTVDLFWADATPSADATMGWGPLVDELRIHRFPGDHIGVLEPRGAQSLAASIAVALEARRAERSG